MHKHRSAKAAISQANDVAGKKRLTAYVPTEPATCNRRNCAQQMSACTELAANDLQYAIAATGKSLSTIVAESLEDWMNKQGYRRPADTWYLPPRLSGTGLTWPKHYHVRSGWLLGPAVFGFVPLGSLYETP